MERVLLSDHLSPDQLFGSFDSDLPRDMKIWRVVYNSDGELSASLLREFPVFRRGPVQTTLSLAGESLLRLSCGEPRHPVFTIHRWSGSSEDSIQSFILIPQKGDFVGTHRFASLFRGFLIVFGLANVRHRLASR